MLRATLKNVNDSHKAGNDSNISLPQSENRINFEYEKYLQFPEMKNPRDLFWSKAVKTIFVLSEPSGISIPEICWVRAGPGYLHSSPLIWLKWTAADY